MYSRFPFSLENIPRQKTFGCLSLRFGCIFSALVLILYTILVQAQCMATLDKLVPTRVSRDNIIDVLRYVFAIGVIICHCVTLALTAIMLAGTLREKPSLMKPWVIWTSFQVLGNLMLIVFWTTINIIFDHMDNGSFIVYTIICLVLLIRFYILMIVSSYYRQLVEEAAERLKTLLNNDTWHCIRELYTETPNSETL